MSKPNQNIEINISSNINKNSTTKHSKRNKPLPSHHNIQRYLSNDEIKTTEVKLVLPNKKNSQKQHDQNQENNQNSSKKTTPKKAELPQSFSSPLMLPSKKGKKVGNYILLNTIGTGTFSKVTLAVHIQTHQLVAAKILDKDKILDKIDIERINHEMEILKLCNHPNISKLYEIMSTTHNIYLIMEYIDGGDLFEYIAMENKINEKKSCYLFRQLISAIEYISKLGIAHRDIKPENILLNKEKNMIKLIDFGLSNFYNVRANSNSNKNSNSQNNDNNKHNNELLKSSCGSPCYASPEMILSYPYNGLNSDLWSCGIVLYCMVAGCLPFDDSDVQILYKKILNGTFAIPDYFSRDLTDFLHKIICVNPDARIKLDEIKKHKWFNLTNNELNKGFTNSDYLIDKSIVKEVKNKFFDEMDEVTCDLIINSIKENSFNKYSSTYFLYLKSKDEDEENIDNDNDINNFTNGNRLERYGSDNNIYNTNANKKYNSIDMGIMENDNISKAKEAFGDNSNNNDFQPMTLRQSDCTNKRAKIFNMELNKKKNAINIAKNRIYLKHNNNKYINKIISRNNMINKITNNLNVFSIAQDEVNREYGTFREKKILSANNSCPNYNSSNKVINTNTNLNTNTNITNANTNNTSNKKNLNKSLSNQSHNNEHILLNGIKIIESKAINNKNKIVSNSLSPIAKFSSSLIKNIPKNNNVILNDNIDHTDNINVSPFTPEISSTSNISRQSKRNKNLNLINDNIKIGPDFKNKTLLNSNSSCRVNEQKNLNKLFNKAKYLKIETETKNFGNGNETNSNNNNLSNASSRAQMTNFNNNNYKLGSTTERAKKNNNFYREQGNNNNLNNKFSPIKFTKYAKNILVENTITSPNKFILSPNFKGKRNSNNNPYIIITNNNTNNNILTSCNNNGNTNNNNNNYLSRNHKKDLINFKLIRTDNINSLTNINNNIFNNQNKGYGEIKNLYKNNFSRSNLGTSSNNMIMNSNSNVNLNNNDKIYILRNKDIKIKSPPQRKDSKKSKLSNLFIPNI